jgi:hypothetical protein
MGCSDQFSLPAAAGLIPDRMQQSPFTNEMPSPGIDLQGCHFVRTSPLLVQLLTS